MATPESTVKKKVKSFLKKHFPSAWVFMPVQMGMGMHGVPDFVTCIPMKIRPEHVGKTVGVLVGIECKAEGKEPTPQQARQIMAINKAKGLAFWVAGVDDGMGPRLEVMRKKIGG